jgi:hypothetical protein
MLLLATAVLLITMDKVLLLTKAETVYLVHLLLMAAEEEDHGTATQLEQVAQEAEAVQLLQVLDQMDTLDQTIVVTLTWAVVE